MRIVTHQYGASTGWSPDLPPPGAATAPEGGSTVVMVFGASAFLDDPAPLRALRAAYPDAVATGCSSAGEILGDDIHDGGLVAAVLTFEQTRVRRLARGIAELGDARALGRALAEPLIGDDLQGIFVLSDGLAINGTQLMTGLQGLLPGVIITGGLAGDDDRFQRTWVLNEAGEPESGTACALGFYGPRVRIGFGSNGGWRIFGPERRITRAVGNEVFELDGEPALALYRRYLGELADGLPGTGLLFPLQVRTDDRPEPVVRTLLAIDEQTQSVTFAADIPQGSRAQLMRTNVDGLLDGAERAAAEAAPDGTSGPMLAVAVSCVGRRMVMSERTEEEAEATLSVLPPGTVQVGFYSYGEISPRGSFCDLHNQTMTLTTITEL